MERRTKIVCTLGPSCDSFETIRSLIQRGMNVARLNFSHGTHEEHRKRLEITRNAAKECGVFVSVLQDLSGPKIRIGDIPPKGGISLSTDDVIEIDCSESAKFSVNLEEVGKMEKVYTIPCFLCPTLPMDVSEGTKILLSDGSIELSVISSNVESNCVLARVVVGGQLFSRKGLACPQASLSVDTITEKDKKDLRFGIQELGVDLVALSFVRSEQDIVDLRKLIREYQSEKKSFEDLSTPKSPKPSAGFFTGDIPIIAKIEQHEALNYVDDILDKADAIMVAQGDLGVEIPIEYVPSVQKHLISRANVAGKPVITATEMLESMTQHSRPTRAEVTDVANAVLDGTDAVMLSAETAAGKFPVAAVEMMHKVCVDAEKRMERKLYSSLKHEELGKIQIPHAIADSACTIAESVNARCIIIPTMSGKTAFRVSRLRPKHSIFALSPDSTTRSKLSLAWGVQAFASKKRYFTESDAMISAAIEKVRECCDIQKGDIAVITAGIPAFVRGSTNLIKVETM